MVYASADKNLGPVAIELVRYILDGLKHLKDEKTYKIISEEQAQEEIKELRRDILNWTFKWRPSLSASAVEYIRDKLDSSAKDPFGYFYLLYKIHKPTLSTRPVCSDCASTPHALGQWVDEMLQPIVKNQPTYFRDSFALKYELNNLTVPENASLFTYDAVSMYTNIHTETCIQRLSSFLLSDETRKKFSHYPAKALLEALTLVMCNNRMKFGDIIAHQISGIAMGMAPAPTIANLFVAIHEASDILHYIGTLLHFLKRFIDDGLGIWLHDPDPDTDRENWARFKSSINSGGLSWTFSPRAQHAVFMDMNIRINEGRIETSLYTKPLALHLYIPPHSCHPSGSSSGLIFGNILRIYQLSSRQADVQSELCNFYSRLLDRGYKEELILPLFSKGIKNAQNYLSYSPEYREKLKQEKLASSSRKIFLHLPYHPQDPSSSTLQHLWRQHIYRPIDASPLDCCTNREGHLIPINQMVVAYSTSLNLGNLLSYRKICKRLGPKVSSFL